LIVVRGSLQRTTHEQRTTNDERFMPRDNIILQCTECKERNYVTTKNKKNTPNRLEFKKFCRRCRCHPLNKENKLSDFGIGMSDFGFEPSDG
jgi:large subunit ribosomal protein L33